MGSAEALARVVGEVQARHGHQALVRGQAERVRSPAPAQHSDLPPWWPGRQASIPRVVEVAGPPSCGKLSVALLWLAALPTGGAIAVVDEAASFHPPAAWACGLPPARLVVIRPPSRRAARDAVALMLGSRGFDAVLWPTSAATRLAGTEAARLAHLAARSGTTLLPLVEVGPDARWGGDGGWGTPALVAGADVRLRVTAWDWTWRDGELAGVRPTVRADRLRGGAAGDAWELVIERHRAGVLGAGGCGAGRDGRAITQADHLCLAGALPAGRGGARTAGSERAAHRGLRPDRALAPAG